MSVGRGRSFEDVTVAHQVCCPKVSPQDPQRVRKETSVFWVSPVSPVTSDGNLLAPIRRSAEARVAMPCPCCRRRRSRTSEASWVSRASAKKRGDAKQKQTGPGGDERQEQAGRLSRCGSKGEHCEGTLAKELLVEICSKTRR